MAFNRIVIHLYKGMLCTTKKELITKYPYNNMDKLRNSKLSERDQAPQGHYSIASFKVHKGKTNLC